MLKHNCCELYISLKSGSRRGGHWSEGRQTWQGIQKGVLSKQTWWIEWLW